MASRTRDRAGAQEVEDIRNLVGAIQTRSAAGIKLTDSFKAQFGDDILDARARKGNRGVHYDFEVLVGPVPGTWRRVEHKGSAAFTPISPTDTPWAAGVQFHNGGCEKYSICEQYARAWYTTHVGSGALTAEWSIAAPIPSFEEWYAKDAKVQGDPKTAFGKELKAAVRGVRGDRGSLLEKREAVLAAFTPTEEELRTLGVEAIVVLNEALDQKDYWLTIHGDPAGDFYCRWWPQFRLGAPLSVVMRKERDVYFDVTCEGDFRFSLLLRWGKGAGFSNLRMDAR
jgi:hypothetical protein